MGLFGDAALAGRSVPLPQVPDWSPMERLKEEFDAIGFYLSAHPLDAYAKSLERIRAKRYADILAEGRSGPVNLAGTVIAKRERTSSRGNRFAFLQLSDTSGMFEVTVFAELLAASRDMLDVGQSLFVKASAQFEGDDSVRFTALAIEPLDQVAARAAHNLRVVIDSPAPLESLRRALAGGNGSDGNGSGSGARGRVTVVSRLDARTEVVIDLPGRYRLSAAVVRAVKNVPGIVEVQEV